MTDRIFAESIDTTRLHAITCAMRLAWTDWTDDDTANMIYSLPSKSDETDAKIRHYLDNRSPLDIANDFVSELIRINSPEYKGDY